MPIVEKLREALKPGRREPSEDGELGRLLAASAKKVLLQRIEFEPASRGLSGQLELLRGKYRPLNASAGPAAPGGAQQEARCVPGCGGGMEVPVETSARRSPPPVPQAAITVPGMASPRRRRCCSPPSGSP